MTAKNKSLIFNNADSISNIFSRVTGGNVSDIDGAIFANGSAGVASLRTVTLFCQGG